MDLSVFASFGFLAFWVLAAFASGHATARVGGVWLSIAIIAMGLPLSAGIWIAWLAVSKQLNAIGEVLVIGVPALGGVWAASAALGALIGRTQR